MTHQAPVPPTHPLTRWRPLLEGEQATEALAAIAGIADDVLAFFEHYSASAPAPWSWQQASGSSCFLGCGWPGVALFMAYLDRAQPGHGHDETAFRILNRAIEGVRELDILPGFLHGFSGLAWTIDHFESEVFAGEGDGDPGQEAAEAIDRWLQKTPWRHGHSLVSGLAGLGLYALDRLPRAPALVSLQRVVTHLAASAEHRPDGIFWRTRTIAAQPATTPPSIPDLGLAHGMAGVLAVLGGASVAGIVEAQPLLAGAVKGMLSLRYCECSAGITRRRIASAPHSAPGATAIDWCYGDLGIASALATAARCVQNPAWEQTALDLARAVTSIDSVCDAARDPCFCHGAAGIAHMLHRLAAAGGSSDLTAAARSWFKRLLQLRKPGAGFGGFQARHVGRDGGARLHDEPGLLTGAAGIGLALLAAATPIPPAWDRALLLSPPRFQFEADLLSGPRQRRMT